GFGCMENPGMVTCVGRAMLFDPATVTPFDRRHIAGAAAHELAHMWFGDIVTLAWWDDIWLNEGLATWIEDRIMAALDPRPDDRFSVVDNHMQALGADSLASARAVRQPIASRDDILNVFDGVTYGKAGAVMTMYEQWLGAASFQKGIRAYLQAHAFGNATTADFIAAMGEAAGKDLSGMSTFLDQAGAPRVQVELQCDQGQAPQIRLRQSRYLPPGAPAPAEAGRPWQFPMCIAHDADGARGQTCTLMSAATAVVPLAAKACPAWVWPNAGGVGHYRVDMAPALIAQLTRAGWAKLTEIERIAAAGDIGALIQGGELPLAAGLDLVPRLMKEGNRPAIDAAVGFAAVRPLVPEARMAAYDRWLLKMFGAPARKLGWLRKPGEALDVDRRRAQLVGLAATAGDRELRKQVVALARDWRKLPREARGRVLWHAVEADPASFDRALAESLTEPDREARSTLQGALTATRDPARIVKALELLLDPRVDIREVMWLPFGFHREPERTLVESWIRDHLDLLQQRLPSETTTGGSSLYAGIFTGACDPARRDQAAAYVTETFGKLPGAEREVRQQIEGMDQCIAYRARVRPQVESWLTSLR
ncbi:MAG TPA: M1 family aminopeptidase, partial [Kofleriaceae bacterium]|nr:M1 family aminopeptidase [Kofleriaceae bacterium]